MPITYTSPHHSDEDPSGLIHDVFELGEEFAGPAREVLFSWVMKLDASIDPALAAQKLIARYELDKPAARSPAGNELLVLLKETATHGLESLKKEKSGRNRSDRRRRNRRRG